MITIGISDLNVAVKDEVLVTYALGSCVGICIYDNMNKIAGLSHIMLPSSTSMAEGMAAGNAMKFADTAIPLLIRKMNEKGAKSIYFKAKIAGGAQMFTIDKDSTVGNIGDRNVKAVKEVLQKLRIPIIAEDTGKNYGRTVFFDAMTGSMKVKSALHGETIF